VGGESNSVIEPVAQIFTVRGVLARLTPSLRRDVRFYAQLQDNFDYMGIEPVTFVRSGASTATWRDGGSHAIAEDKPAFEYSDEDTPLGLRISATESLNFPPGNLLHDDNPILWFEENVLKSVPDPLDPMAVSPIDSNGDWIGNTDVHIRELLKFKSAKTLKELYDISVLINEPGQIIPVIVDSGIWKGPITPSGTIPGTSFTLPDAPDTATLTLMYNTMMPEQVLTGSPTAIQYKIVGQAITTGFTVNAGDLLHAFYRIA
jgi:hypothetical protein